MRALVTGGAGFIGSHLVEMLLEQGHEVLVMDNLLCGRKENLSAVEKHPRFHLAVADIRNRESITPLFEGIDWVFHLAGLADLVPAIENPTDYYAVNVTGTFNVLEAARHANVKRLIYAASSTCYGTPDVYPTPESAPLCPQHPYGLTKKLGEDLVLHWGQVYRLPVLSLRLFNVYGPRARTNGTYGAVFGVFLTQKWHRRPFTVVGDGTQVRDFIFVTDIARAFCKAAESNLKGECFNVGSTAPQSVNRLVELLGGDVVYVPKRPGEPDCTFADVSKIQQALQWKPLVSFEEGVKRVVERLEDYKNAPLWEPKSIQEATKSWFQHLQQSEASTCS